MDKALRIFFWSASLYDGCYFYRCLGPSQSLTSSGHQTDTHTSWKEDWRDAAVLVGQRVCEMGASNLFTRQTDSRYTIYEIDDDLTALQPDNPGYKFFNEADTIKAYTQSLEAAHAVTVSTERLASVMRQFNQNVFVCKNGIPDYYLHYPRVDQSEVKAVGWQGSATHHNDVLTVSEPLRAIFTTNPKVSMHTVGTDYLREVTDNYNYAGWIAADEVTSTYDFQIGLCPISSNVFNASKSAIKVYEYWSRGIVPVASNFGPYREIEDGVTGFRVKNAKEWEDRINLLINDHSLRQKMSDACYDAAHQVTMEKRLPSWELALEGAYNHPALRVA